MGRCFWLSTFEKTYVVLILTIVVVNSQGESY